MKEGAPNLTPSAASATIIKDKMRNLNWNREMLARRIGVSSSSLSRFLSDPPSGGLSRTNFQRLCVALAMTEAELKTIKDRNGNPIKVDVVRDRQIRRHELDRVSDVWLILPKFRLSRDEEMAEEVAKNLKTINYVFFSSNKNELYDAVSALGDHRKDRLTCIAGPEWLDFATWSLEWRSGTRRLFHLSTLGGLPLNSVVGDDEIGKPLEKLLRRVLEELKDKDVGASYPHECETWSGTFTKIFGAVENE